MTVEDRVVALMKAAKVTPNEALAFMGTALATTERHKSGSAHSFLNELITRRTERKVPDASRWMW